MDFKSATLGKGVNFSNSNFTVSSTSQGNTAEVTSSSSSSAYINSTAMGVYFNSAILNGDANFNGTSFTATAVSKNNTISSSNSANTKSSTSAYGASFDSATFGDNADLSNSTFTATATSEGNSVSTSSSEANAYAYANAYGARFDSATFGDNANFSNSTFTATATNKDNTAISQSLGTYATSYAYGANFSKATFGDNADFSNSTFTATLTSVNNTTTYTDNVAGGADFFTVILKNANFQNVKVDIKVNGLDETNTLGMRFSYATLTNVDFRGSNVSDYCINNGSTRKNIIYSDGTIRNFSMASAADNWTIARHTPREGSVAINAKISEANAAVSGGATLTLADGAVLEVSNGKSLGFDSTSTLAIEFAQDSDYAAMLLSESASLDFATGAKLSFNVLGDLSGLYSFDLIQWDSTCDVSSLLGLLKDDTILLYSNGVLYTEDWSFTIENDRLNIGFGKLESSLFSLMPSNFQTTPIPEPSDTAIIFGVISVFAIIIIRRKK